MTERRFYWLASVSLIALVIMTILGAAFDSVTWLFEVSLAVTGILAGLLTSSYYHKKSEQQSLGKYASAGLRLSFDIYDSLNEIIETIEELRESTHDGGRFSKRDMSLMFDIISGELRVLQRFALSANNQWSEVLPTEQLQELRKRERIIALSEDRELQITEETRVLQK